MPQAQRSTPKSERTRAAILAAARALFAAQGYERTTVRDVAAAAAVDPALVIRYFASKDALFARATTFDLRLPDLGAVPPARLGRAVAAHFLDQWEGPASGALTILLRAAATSEDAADRMRAIFAGQVVPLLARMAPPAEVAARAGLVSSQLLGLALARYVLKLPPVVAMQRDQIVRWVGPALQRYIAGKLE